jgi:hypothetical protein
MVIHPNVKSRLNNLRWLTWCFQAPVTIFRKNLRVPA